MYTGMLVPLIIFGYLGILLSYQKPFIDTIDLRIPGMFSASFGLGLLCALISRTYVRTAMWLCGWGILIVALVFFIRG